MNTAHLFSGSGGGLLADLIIGHTPALAVEIEESCCRSLRNRKDEGWFPSLHIHHGDIRQFDFQPWRGRVDQLSAGFPCQDISAAGTGKGLSGSRSGLVFEVFRAIDTLWPGLIFLENSPHIRTKGRDVIIKELVARGYSWKDGKIAASDVGAPHKRERWFCLAANVDGMRQLQQKRRKFEQWGWIGNSIKAYADTDGFGSGRRKSATTRHNHYWNDSERKEKTGWTSKCAEDAADHLRDRLQVAIQCGGLSEASAKTIKATAGYTGAYDWAPPDIGICGMVDGVAVAMDGNPKRARIKGCGNGQVPLQAALAWLILAFG